MTSRPVLYSAIVGSVLGAALTVLIVVGRGCQQSRPTSDECANRASVMLLIGLPLMVIAGWVVRRKDVPGAAGSLILRLGVAGAVRLLGADAQLRFAARERAVDARLACRGREGWARLDDDLG